MSPKLSPGLFWSQWVWAVTWFWWARATTWSWWVELPLDSDETDLLPHLPHLMNLSRTWSWWVWPVTWSWWVWFVTCHLVHFKLMTVPLDPDEPELQSNPPNFTKLMSCCLILMSLMSCHLAHLILTILSCRLIYLTSRKASLRVCGAFCAHTQWQSIFRWVLSCHLAYFDPNEFEL